MPLVPPYIRLTFNPVRAALYAPLCSHLPRIIFSSSSSSSPSTSSFSSFSLHFFKPASPIVSSSSSLLRQRGKLCDMHSRGFLIALCTLLIKVSSFSAVSYSLTSPNAITSSTYPLLAATRFSTSRSFFLRHTLHSSRKRGEPSWHITRSIRTRKRSVCCRHPRRELDAKGCVDLSLLVHNWVIGKPKLPDD